MHYPNSSLKLEPDVPVFKTAHYEYAGEKAVAKFLRISQQNENILFHYYHYKYEHITDPYYVAQRLRRFVAKKIIRYCRLRDGRKKTKQLALA